MVVDLETTGLYPSQDRILEIGAVKVLDGEVTDTFCMFADPQMKIPERIRELTGITQEMVEGQPTPAEAVRAFLDFCGEQDLMGHNLIFDYSFLKHQAADQKIPFEKNGIDTLKIARILLPDLESRSLTNLCGYFQIDRRTPTVHITMHWQRMNCISIWCGSQKKDRSGSFSRNSYSIK